MNKASGDNGATKAYQRLTGLKRANGTVRASMPGPPLKKAAPTERPYEQYDSDDDRGFGEEEEEPDASAHAKSVTPQRPHVPIPNAFVRKPGPGGGAASSTISGATARVAPNPIGSASPVLAPLKAPLKVVPPPSRTLAQNQSQVSSEQTASSKGSTTKAIPGKASPAENSPLVKPMAAKQSKPPAGPPPAHLLKLSTAKSARPRPPQDSPEDDALGQPPGTASATSGQSPSTAQARRPLPTPRISVGAPKHPAPPKASEESPKHPRPQGDSDGSPKPPKPPTIDQSSQGNSVDAPKHPKIPTIVPAKVSPLSRAPSSSTTVSAAEAAAAANPKSSPLPAGPPQDEVDIADHSQRVTISASRPSASLDAPQPTASQHDKHPASVISAAHLHYGNLASPQKPEPREEQAQKFSHEVKNDEKEAVGDDVLSTVALSGLCDMRVIDLLDWPSFFEDMIKDVEKECQKFGMVVRSWADRKAALATVYLRFSTAEEAQLCSQKMENRRFAGQKVTTKLHAARVWQSLTGE